MTLENRFEASQKFNKEREDRLAYCLRQWEYETERKHYFFLYETGPLDYFEGWESVWDLKKNAYQDEMENDECLWGAKETVHKANRLLCLGLSHFSNYLKYDFRGELLHYCTVNQEEQGVMDNAFMVICFKADNNGTCYAFCQSPKIAKLLPHDFGGDWELCDAVDINHR